MDQKILLNVIQKIAPEMFTLQDCIELLAFYFAEPVCDQIHVHGLMTPEHLPLFINILEEANTAVTKEEWLTIIKEGIKKNQLSNKEVFTVIRYALTGSEKGLGIVDLVTLLDYKKIKERLGIVA